MLYLFGFLYFILLGCYLVVLLIVFQKQFHVLPTDTLFSGIAVAVAVAVGGCHGTRIACLFASVSPAVCLFVLFLFEFACNYLSNLDSFFSSFLVIVIVIVFLFLLFWPVNLCDGIILEDHTLS